MARAKKIPLIADFNHIPAEALVPEEEWPYPIPKHWKWVRLESVVEMRIGKTPARAEEKYWDSYDYPWVKISDFTDEGVIAGSQEQISSVAFREVFKGRLVPAGTLLMSFKLTIGKCAILDIAAVHNEAIISIFPQCSIVNRDYLFHCLPTITQFGIQRSAVKGSTLNSNSLNALPLPLPPLTEQKQIVAYLDEKLGKIDSVREKLQDFLDHADKRKDNLIQAAITGHLTHQWRDQHSVSMASWKQVQLGKLGKWGGGGTPSKSKSSFWDGGTIRWITSKDMKTSEILDTLDHITAKAVEESTANLYQEPAICVVMRSGILRRTLPIAKVNGEFTVNQDLKVLHAFADGVEPDFIYLALLGHSDRILDVCSKSGTTVESIEFSKLKDYEIELPVLPEQEEIARILDEQLARIDAADSKVQEALDQLNLLKEQLVSAALAGRFSNAK